MSATVQDLLEYFLIEKASIQRKKARIISSHFGTIDSFLNAKEVVFANLKFVGGENACKLNRNELIRIKALQDSQIIQKDLSPNQNLSWIHAKNFLNNQIKNINELSIVDLNCNPVLITTLKLDSPEEMLRYCVFQSASRSIVTSFGFFVQKLLLYSGENVFDGKNEEAFHSTKWDLVKIIDETRSWIEVKSGPNDLNKTQILSYQKAIELVEQHGEKAFIGETYGNREQDTITHSLYMQYLGKWEERTLIGKELWAFVSDDINYKDKIMSLLREVAKSVLQKGSVLDAIESKVKELLKVFETQYSSLSEFIDSLW